MEGANENDVDQLVVDVQSREHDVRSREHDVRVGGYTPASTAPATAPAARPSHFPFRLLASRLLPVGCSSSTAVAPAPVNGNSKPTKHLLLLRVPQPPRLHLLQRITITAAHHRFDFDPRLSWRPHPQSVLSTVDLYRAHPPFFGTPPQQFHSTPTSLPVGPPPFPSVFGLRVRTSYRIRTLPATAPIHPNPQ